MTVSTTSTPTASTPAASTPTARARIAAWWMRLAASPLPEWLVLLTAALTRAAPLRAELDLPDGVPVLAVVARVDPMKDHAGFYWGRMDKWTEDGATVPGPREIPGRIDTTTQFKVMFPKLAAEWHPEKNVGISPYEFAATSGQVVWWQDASGKEWQESIRDRVLAATELRGDGDAHPYG